MSHTIFDHSDNIAKVGFVGDIGKEQIDPFYEEVTTMLESYTEANPLSFIVDCSQEGYQSLYARRVITQINNDLRVKKIALVQARPVTRVVGTFIMKATGRKNINFFDDEKDARSWLQEK